MVEETEKGWMVQWIDRDPRLVARQAAYDAKQQEEMDDESRQRAVIAAQMAMLKARTQEGGPSAVGSAVLKPEELELKRETDAPKISLKAQVPAAKKRVPVSLSGANVLALAADSSSSSSSSESQSQSQGKAGMSNIERLMHEDAARKSADLMRSDAQLRSQHKAWLFKGLQVKVVNKHVAGGALYKSKAKIDAVVADGFGAECIVDVEGQSVRAVLDQDHLETTVPKVGAIGLVVRGAGRGLRAAVTAIHTQDFNCDLRLEEAPYQGVMLKRREYEDVCRLAKT